MYCAKSIALPDFDDRCGITFDRVQILGWSILVLKFQRKRSTVSTNLF